MYRREKALFKQLIKNGSDAQGTLELILACHFILNKYIRFNSNETKVVNKNLFNKKNFLSSQKLSVSKRKFILHPT